MNKGGGKQQKHKKHFHKQQNRRSKAESDEIESIERVLAEQAPPRGSNPLAVQQAEAAAAGAPAEGAAGPAAATQKQQQQEPQAAVGFSAARKFEDLPISEYSKQGLREAKYVALTAVQRAALPHALCGRDVLGAAKTGSGGCPLRVRWCGRVQG